MPGPAPAPPPTIVRPGQPGGASTRPAFVDAGPAREHVQMLGRFGIGWKRVAALAGRPEPTMYALLYGTESRPPRQKIKPETEAAILAVKPTAANLADGARVDATGTRRRLQALAAIGWPQRWLAVRLGWEWRNFHAVIHRKDKIWAATARAVCALYDQLWNQLPPQRTAAEHKAVAAAISTAAAHDWLPPQAWDEEQIDDPSATAEDCRRHGRRSQAVLLEEASELMTSYGYGLEQAAARLGTTRAVLEKAFSRAAAAVTTLPRAILVPIAPYRHRTQALVALGHPKAWLAAQLEMGRAAFHRLLNGPQNWIPAEGARAVLALYRKLRDQRPPPGTEATSTPQRVQESSNGPRTTSPGGSRLRAGHDSRRARQVSEREPGVTSAAGRSRLACSANSGRQRVGGPVEAGTAAAGPAVHRKRAFTRPVAGEASQYHNGRHQYGPSGEPDRVGAPATPVSGRPAKMMRCTPSGRYH